MSLVLILICGDPKTQTGNQGPGSHAESAEGRESDPLFSLPSLLHNEPWAVIQPSVFLGPTEMRGSQFALEKNSTAFEDALPSELCNAALLTINSVPPMPPCSSASFRSIGGNGSH